MKKRLLILLFLLQSAYSFAGHIAGGEIYYRYLGPGNGNTSRYEITVRLFRECNPPPNADPNVSTATMPAAVDIAIYNNTNPSTTVVGRLTVNRSSFQSSFQLTKPDPCIIVPVGTNICYQVGTFITVQELPNTAAGYVVSFQTCCRTYNVANIQTFSFVDDAGRSANGEGATYSCQIPGTSNGGATNSSAVFALKDTTLVCNFSPFKLDFSATDPDAGDSLSYSFCSAFDRGNTTSSSFPNAGYSLPPYNTVTYASGFSGSQPLGANVTINPVTGIISGIAPAKGRYVVNVCITEWRNNVVVRQHRKDFTLIVEDCTLVGAELKPAYITCDGFTMSFENQSTSPNISSYLWDFGERNVAQPTSTSATPTHTYADTGVYVLKLKVTNTGGCQDSATAPVRVFPGFTSDFSVQGTCVLNPYQFKDASVTNYGVVDSWRWDFGDVATLADTARSKDSAWKYPSLQTVKVTLITTNSKGCIDTITKSVTIVDRPQLSLPFKDTLICSIDTLMLRVNTVGSVAWTPEIGPNRLRIQNANTTTPIVFPQNTTRYAVSVNDNGCANTDTVTVNVLQFINVDVTDTAICVTDTFRLHPVSQALSYQWTSSTAGEVIAGAKYPLVKPLVNTKYLVTANLGKCQAKDSMQVVVAPYPTATAGPDMIVCYGSRVQLSGTITGNAFSWSPTSSLMNERTLTPTAGPTRTTNYILTATNTIGCLKPKSDTLVVTVIPIMTANAGRDTTILPGQPLQMEATGGTLYAWRPSTGLSDPNIANPIAILDNTIDSILYTVRVSEAGCFAEDQVMVRVYKPGADILVPSAFTPNADGKNDLVRPYTIGISKFMYFSIYNRWGQLLFTTTEPNKGWGGYFNGVAQPAGTYVYQALGLDYLGNQVYRKGSVVLIR